MHKTHAHVHVGHYQNVFKSAPCPIASYAMLSLCAWKYEKKLTTCYSIVGEHPSTTTRTASSENHVTQIVPMKTSNSQIYHSKIAYYVLQIAILMKCIVKAHPTPYPNGRPWGVWREYKILVYYTASLLATYQDRITHDSATTIKFDYKPGPWAVASLSLAWPDPFRAAAYRLEIISAALLGSGIVHDHKIFWHIIGDDWYKGESKTECFLECYSVQNRKSTRNFACFSVTRN